MSEFPPYRAGVSIDDLQSRVEKLEAAIEKLKWLETHHHGMKDVNCPGCGVRMSVITKPWEGIEHRCQKKPVDIGKAARSVHGKEHF